MEAQQQFFYNGDLVKLLPEIAKALKVPENRVYTVKNTRMMPGDSRFTPIMPDYQRIDAYTKTWEHVEGPSSSFIREGKTLPTLEGMK